MAIKGFFLVGLLNLALLLNAQTSDKNLAIGLNFVKNEYNGDYGNGIFNFNEPWYVAGGISLSAYLTQSFDLGVQGSYGSYGYFETDVNQFSGAKFDLSLFTHYKLNNGYMLDEDSKLSPFISVGLGLATYGTINSYPFPTIITKGVDLIIPLGAGLKYQLTNSFAIQYQYLYNITNADNHDENRGPNLFGSSTHPFNKPGNDVFGQHVVSIIFNFRGPGNHRFTNVCRCLND